MTESSKQFEAIFQRHHKPLCDVAYNFVRDPEIAKDIVQDVFLKLWRNIQHIELSDQIGGYLFKATTHTALNHLRNNGKTISIEQNPSVDKKVMTMQTPSQEDFSELETIVENAIDKLPARCRVIYLLSRNEGLKYNQIAETLGLSVKTVENQMTIALERIRGEVLPYLRPQGPLVFTSLLTSFFSMFF
ncbi:MAG TPA: RNA polymerase sigma-70 factor [Chryseosolibacter sp.]